MRRNTCSEQTRKTNYVTLQVWYLDVGIPDSMKASTDE